MTLADLKNMIENVNTLGFKPEEVEINFNYYFSELKVEKVETKVRADKEVKPVATISLR
jgi:flagellar basal body rod protein FlgG